MSVRPGAGSFSVHYGLSNTDKTFVAVDLAAHVASGKAWRGCRIKPGPVIYVAAEGGGGIRNRIAAIREAKPVLGRNAEFFFVPTHLDLHEARDAMAHCAAMPTDKPALVVIDALARSMGAGDKNSARDMRQFVANLDKIRECTGAHVLVVHHSGKNAKPPTRRDEVVSQALSEALRLNGRERQGGPTPRKS